MSNIGGYRPGSGRPLGSLNGKTIELMQTIRDIVSQHPEKYERAVVMLLEDAMSNDVKPRDRLAIINFFVERLEGKPTEKVELTNSSQTVDTVLAALRASTHQKSSGDVVSHSSEGEE